MSKSITYGPTSDGRFAVGVDGVISEFCKDIDEAKKSALKLSDKALRQYFVIPAPKPAAPEEPAKKPAPRKKAQEPKPE